MTARPYPALADVLGALTNVEARWLRPFTERFTHLEISPRGLYSGLTVYTDRGPHRGATFCVVDPRAAWELLATRGLIPMTWVDDPGRRFVCTDGDCNGDGIASVDPFDGTTAVCPSCAGAGLLPHPSRLDEVVAFAADVGGVAQAEALAREVLPFERAVWSLIDPRSYAMLVARRGGQSDPWLRGLTYECARDLAASRATGQPPPYGPGAREQHAMYGLLAEGYALVRERDRLELWGPRLDMPPSDGGLTP